VVKIASLSINDIGLPPLNLCLVYLRAISMPRSYINAAVT
jgi:hypothetical protein